jgi:hypothetical protein
MSNEAPALTWKGRLIALGIGLFILLIAAEVILRIAMPHWREFYSGWFMRAINIPSYGLISTGEPGFDGYFAQNNGDFRVHIKINDFGLRSNEPVEKADGRIWVVGDSMTFGWGVEENEIYSSVLAKHLQQETFNIASPGTDICGYQALLSRMPDNLTPRAVVMGLILENDIGEYNCDKRAARQAAAFKAENSKKSGAVSVMSIKRQLTENLALYNFMAVSLKRVNIIREVLTAIKVIKPTDNYKNPIFGNDFDKVVDNSVAKIVKFQKMLPKGTPFLVVIAPGRFELRNGDPLYARLRKAIGLVLGKHEIVAVDPFDSFRKVGYGPTHFAHDGHWTVLGHQLAGEAVAERLSKMLVH